MLDIVKSTIQIIRSWIFTQIHFTVFLKILTLLFNKDYAKFVSAMELNKFKR